MNEHFLPRVLQTKMYNYNFIVLLLISSRISQNWFPTASGFLLMVSIIIYFNKCNRFDIIILYIWLVCIDDVIYK